MPRRKIMIPSYMEQFQCIGTACEDSCCVGWLVNIDQEAYKKYAKIQDKELRPLIEKNVKRHNAKRSHENFAKIKMSAQHECVFLSEEKLCKIQAKYGEKYLSNTCAIYPRQLNEVDFAAEKSATLSCPEAARLALLNPAGLKFVEIEEADGIRFAPQKTIHPGSLPFANKAQRYFTEIRTFVMQLLQYRAISLDDRLVLLGHFCEKLQEHIDHKTIKDIPAMFEYYLQWLADDTSRAYLDYLPSNYGIQMQLIKEILDERLAIGLNNQRYIECLKEMMLGLQYIQGAMAEDILHKYIVAFKTFYQPFMQEHEYILENYLVNYVFKNLFPFEKSLSVFDEYVLLVVHYALIKLHLVGLSAYHSGLTTDIVVKLVQSFAKTVEHNAQYLQAMINLLRQSGLTSLAYMRILIKN